MSQKTSRHLYTSISGLPVTYAPGQQRTVLYINDASGSMGMTMADGKRRISALRQSLCASLDLLASSGSDVQAGMIAFGTTAELVHPIASVVSNHQSLMDAAQRFRMLELTNMRSAFSLACRTLLPLRNGKATIIFLTDGSNTGQDPLPPVNKLKKAGVRIYCVQISDDCYPEDKALLEKIASPVNGRPALKQVESKRMLARAYDGFTTRAIALDK